METYIDEFVGFMDEISKNISSIENVEIPDFYIPNWPFNDSIIINIGRGDFPLVKRNENTGLLQVIDCGNSKSSRKGYQKVQILFYIFRDGSMAFKVSYKTKNSRRKTLYFNSTHDKLNKINVLLMFQCFKDKICNKIFKILSDEVEQNNKIVNQAKEALKPFIPYLIADVLDN